MNILYDINVTPVTHLSNEIDFILLEIRWDETLLECRGSTFIHLTKLYSNPYQLSYPLRTTFQLIFKSEFLIEKSYN